VGLVALVTFVMVPAFGWGPEVIFLTTTAASFVEGGLGVWLLGRFLREAKRRGCERPPEPRLEPML
jgi:hypothetical protein